MEQNRKVGPVVSCEGATKPRPHVIVVSRSNSRFAYLVEDERVGTPSQHEERFFTEGRLRKLDPNKEPTIVTTTGYYKRDENGKPIYCALMECSACEFQIVGGSFVSVQSQRPNKCQAKPPKANCTLNGRR